MAPVLIHDSVPGCDSSCLYPAEAHKVWHLLYSIGSNEEATRLSGVNVDFNKIMSYAICGVCVAFAGMVMLAKLGTGEPAAGASYETNAIAAAAIGGTSLAGGKGSIIGTFLGAILLQALKVGWWSAVWIHSGSILLRAYH